MELKRGLVLLLISLIYIKCGEAQLPVCRTTQTLMIHCPDPCPPNQQSVSRFYEIPAVRNCTVCGFCVDSLELCPSVPMRRSMLIERLIELPEDCDVRNFKMYPLKAVIGDRVCPAGEAYSCD